MNFNNDSGIIDTVFTIDTTQTPPSTGTGTQYVLTILGGAITLPTSADSVTAVPGMIRYNTGGWVEAYYSSAWNTFTSGSGVTISTVSGTGPYYLAMTASTSGSLSAADVNTSLSFNATTGVLSSTSFTGAGTGLTGTAASLSIGGTAAVSTTSTITSSSTNSTFYPTFVSATTGNLADNVNTSLTFNPSSGVLSATTFAGSGASLTSIPNTALTNSSITIGSTTVALGASSTSLAGMTGITFSSGTVTGLANPVNATDAVNLQYLQNVEAGLVWKQEVMARTVEDFSVLTGTAAAYSNGSSGVGATLTNAGTKAALVLDGYTVLLGDRVLVANQSDGSPAQYQNGIYYQTTLGTGSVNWVLTRTLDADTPDGLDAATVFVVNGTANANTAWTQTTAAPTIGSGGSNVVFVQNYAVSGYVAGAGLTLTGNSFAITAPVTAALGGTGTVTNPTSGQILVGTSSNTYVPYTLASGTGISTTTGSGTLQINNTGVTSNVATANQTTVSSASGAVTIGLASALIAPGSLQVTTSFQVSTSSGLSISSGTTQGSNAQTNDYNQYTTVGSGIAATLPAGLAGRLVTTVNRGANALTLFPASGASIDGLSANTSVSVPAGQTYTAKAISATQWYSVTNTFAAGTNTSVSVSNGIISFSVSGTVAAAATVTVVNNTASASTWYPTFVSTDTGNLAITTALSNLTYVPSTGTLTSTVLSASTLTSTVSTGTAPFTVTSTTQVSNLTAQNSGNTLVTTSTTNTAFPIALSPTSSTGQQSLLMDTSVTINASTGLLSATNLTATGLTAKSFLYSGTGGALATTSAPTNGQLLIGSTGAVPVAAALATTGNSIYVTNGAGTITLAGPKFFAEDTGTAPGTAPSATASQSVAIGNSALASIYGQIAMASGDFSSAGDAQHSIFILRNATSNATSTELFLDGSSAEWVLPLSSVVTFSILVSAIFNSTGGSVANTFSAGFKIEGIAYVGATAATIVLVGTQSLTVLGRISSTMTASVVANTGTGALKVMVTGVASTNINWVAVVQTCEVGHT